MVPYGYARYCIRNHAVLRAVERALTLTRTLTLTYGRFPLFGGRPFPLTDGRTDGQTDILVANATLTYAVWRKIDMTDMRICKIRAIH